VGLQGLYAIIQTKDSIKHLDEIDHQIYNFFCMSYSSSAKREGLQTTWFRPKNNYEISFLSKSYPNSYFQFAITRNFQFIALTSLLSVVWPVIRHNQYCVV
jgi:hypothetical protein